MHSETSVRSADLLVRRSASRRADMTVRAPFREFKEWLQHGGRWPRFRPVYGGLDARPADLSTGSQGPFGDVVGNGPSNSAGVPRQPGLSREHPAPVP